MAAVGADRESRVMVLRMGHRIPRDERVTTHVCLTARALGADGVFVSDVQDRGLVERINRVTQQFGGRFIVETGKSWRSTINEWRRIRGVVIHLTAYGMPLPKVVSEIRRSKRDKLVVVGAEKMPGQVFGLADWNVAVTSQPISEVSALGIFLDWLFQHQRLEEPKEDGRVRIVPNPRGKTVLTTR